MSEKQRSIRIDWVQAMAGALTAITTAVLLSTVGVAGTLIGAAVGSLAASVGNAVYGHYIALSRERVVSAKVVTSARARAETARGGHVDDLAMQDAQEDPDHARQEPVRPEAPARVSWREAVKGLAWRRIGVVAAGVFVLAMGAILTFELVTGRAVSTYTGGTEQGRTSVPGLGGADRQTDPSGEPGQDRTGGTPSTDPETPSPTVLGTEGAETDPDSDVRPAPQATPSQAPTSTSSPSATTPVPSPTPSAQPSGPSAP